MFNKTFWLRVANDFAVAAIVVLAFEAEELLSVPDFGTLKLAGIAVARAAAMAGVRAILPMFKKEN